MHHKGAAEKKLICGQVVGWKKNLITEISVSLLGLLNAIQQYTFIKLYTFVAVLTIVALILIWENEYVFGFSITCGHWYDIDDAHNWRISSLNSEHSLAGCSSFCTTWWRHQMEIFSALLSICAGNSPVPGEFPAQRPVTWSFDVFFDLRVNKRLSKQSWGWWFETLSWSLWRHCNEKS